MAGFKLFLVLAVVVCAAYAAEEKAEEKKEEVAVEADVKEAEEPKEITDDGSYWPGKYPGTATVLVPSLYHSLVPSVAAVPQVPYVHSAVYPYAYSHLPISRSIVF